MQQLHKSQQLDVICTQVLFISQVLEVLTLCALASLTMCIGTMSYLLLLICPHQCLSKFICPRHTEGRAKSHPSSYPCKIAPKTCVIWSLCTHFSFYPNMPDKIWQTATSFMKYSLTKWCKNSFETGEFTCKKKHTQLKPDRPGNRKWHELLRTRERSISPPCYPPSHQLSIKVLWCVTH